MYHVYLKKNTPSKYQKIILFKGQDMGSFSPGDHPLAGTIGSLPLSRRLLTSPDGSRLRNVKQKLHVIIAVAGMVRKLCILFYHKETETFRLYSQGRTTKPTSLFSDAWMLWPFCKDWVPENH